MRLQSYVILICLSGFSILLFPELARAAFVPLDLTADSFNQDVIVEKSGPAPLVPVTTASMDTGTNNTGFSFYEKGYNPDNGTSGLPLAGVSFTSEAVTDRDYQLAPNYKTNNAVLIDSAITSGTLTFINPAAFYQLSLLVAAGTGPGQIQFTIHYQNSSTQTGMISCPDWYFALGAACVSYGRIDVNTFNFDSVSSGHPGLFARDITLSNSTSMVTSIDFAYVSGASHNTVFAISAAPNPGDPFVPVGVRGYNADLIVEASATRHTAFASATTATIDHGAVNAGKTFYEQGYYSPAPFTGLPAPGSTITNAAAPDHRYVMANSYSNNNAVVVDADFPSATITFASPAAFGTLSFLCAAGHGPVTNVCIAHHANGLAETNTIVVSDWLSNAVPAFSLNGRVNIDNRMVDLVNSGSPRLFACDVALANTVSPVTNLVLNFAGGPADAHALFFAVSGAPVGAVSPPAVLSINRNANGSFTLASTQPGQLQATTALQGTNTIWQNLGTILTATNIVPSGTQSWFYRVVGQ